MSARHVYIIGRIDKKIGILFGLFDNFNPFSVTKQAISGAKGLDCTHRIALPEDATSYRVPLQSWAQAVKVS